jgi:hypothetical protein
MLLSSLADRAYLYEDHFRTLIFKTLVRWPRSGQL